MEENKEISVIKNKKVTRILDVINNFLDRIFKSKYFNYTFWVLGIIVILAYLGMYFYLTPIVDEEVRPDVTNNLIPWEVKSGESFLKALIERPFNLNITEYGQYRPRWLAFVVQFIDENIFFKVTRALPIFGNRQPFYILAVFFNVFAMYYLLKHIWKKIPKGLLFFVSSTILIFQNYQVATYWRARSAKLLCVGVCLLLIDYAIRLLDEKVEKKNIYKVLYSVPIFILMTLDEQVLGMVVMLTALLVFFSIINKKLNIGTIIYSLSCFIYATFHLWWGKWLFGYFTGSLAKHGHTIEGAVEGLNIGIIFESLKILASCMPKLIFLSFGVFVVIWFVLFIYCIVNKKEKNIDKFKKAIIALFFILSSICLLTLMIVAHPAIYSESYLWISVYPIVSSIVMLCGIIYLMGNVDIKWNNLKYLVLIVGISASLIYNFSKINSYYGAYLKSKGGEVTSVSDLIVTKDNIIVNVYKEDKLNFDNHSLRALLNTPFSTDNISTTKIIEGKEKNSNYINDKLSFYMIVKENRKLNLNIEFDDYTEFESVYILVNDKKVAQLDINSKELNESVFMGNEINRACKIDLVFNRIDNDTISKNDILLRECYMN